MAHLPEPIVMADCTACGERDHETLLYQWHEGGRPRCGFCGEPLTRRVVEKKPRVKAAKTKDPRKEQS